MKQIYTIGVYGKSEENFFQEILLSGIEIFYDVRNRRGMRGKKYSFVNSKYLQQKLSDLHIEYFHIKELSPTNILRIKQKDSDKISKITKRKRKNLSEEFCHLYEDQVLSKFDFRQLIEEVIVKNKNICFFCVESDPNACHRSIITERIIKLSNSLEVKHI